MDDTLSQLTAVAAISMAGQVADAPLDSEAERAALTVAAADALVPAFIPEAPLPVITHGLRAWFSVKVSAEGHKRFGQAGYVINVGTDPLAVPVQFDDDAEVVAVADLVRL